MTELIQSFAEALANAQAFQPLDEHQDSRAFANLDHFFHWYYFPDYGIFAPAKFIGYRDSQLDTYRSHGRHVHDAQEVLSAWFERLDPEDPLFDDIQDKLKTFLEANGAHLHAHDGEETGGIYVPA
jgi:hypothetical protein